MFKRLRQVAKNKNRISKVSKQRRVEEINSMRAEAIFRASLTEDLKIVSLVLADPEVSDITVSTRKEDIGKLTSAMYSPDMGEYTVIKNGEQFKVSRKIINF